MKVLLFDFGGTLDTNGVHWSEKLWEVYQQAGVDIPKNAFERAYVAAESKMSNGIVFPDDGLQRTLERQVTLQLEELTGTGDFRNHLRSPGLAQRIAKNACDDVRKTMGEIRPLLNACYCTYTLGVVSNFYGNLVAVCLELDIATFFSVMIDSAVIGIRKPDPRIFETALRKIGAGPSEATVIGDSYERDIVPAKTLGCSTVWLRGKSWKSPQEVSKADRVIDSLLQLYSVLKLNTDAIT
jgi:FMN phosphatase YigB (HAD superfamily)